MSVVVACNPTVWRQRQEDPLGLTDSQCSLIGDLPANGRSCSKEVDRVPGMTPKIVLSATHTHVRAHVIINAYGK